MGLIQSLFGGSFGEYFGESFRGSFGEYFEEPIKKCVVCEKEIDSHVARESICKSSTERIVYFCTWRCYEEYFRKVS